MYLPEGGSATIVALAAVLRVLERKRFGGPKVAQMHPDNIRQRPGSVRAISAQHPGNIAAAVSASPPPFVLPPMFFSTILLGLRRASLGCVKVSLLQPGHLRGV